MNITDHDRIDLRPGEEHYDSFVTCGSEWLHYDYRHHSGELFSCVAKSLTQAREKRDAWLKRRE
jgi:hypothetical protein